jgi:hypothetical protein
MSEKMMEGAPFAIFLTKSSTNDTDGAHNGFQPSTSEVIALTSGKIALDCKSLFHFCIQLLLSKNDFSNQSPGENPPSPPNISSAAVALKNSLPYAQDLLVAV